MKPLYLLVGGGVVALAILFYVAFADGGWPRVKQLQAEEDSLQTQVRALQGENKDLAGKAQLLKEESASGKAILETAVRQELGYVKPDEKILILEKSPPPAKETP
jgi:cell division protein FtsB